MLTSSRHSLHELFQGARGNNDHINKHPHQLTKAQALPLQAAEFPVCHFFRKSWNKLPSVSAAVQYKAVQFPHQLLPCTRKISTGASFGYRNSRVGTTVSAPANCWAQRHSISLYSRAEFWGILEDWTASGLQRCLLFQAERQIWVCMKEARGLNDIFKTASHPNITDKNLVVL